MSDAGLLFVLCNPVPGRESEFEQWWAADTTAVAADVAGVGPGGRYRLNAQQRRDEDFVSSEGAGEEPEQQVVGRPSPWQYLAVHEVVGDGDAVLRDLQAHRASSVTGDSPLDPVEQWRFWEPAGPRVLSPAAQRAPGAQRHLWVALTDAVPGREDDFGEWYDQFHVPEIVGYQLGGISGRRYRLADSRSADGPVRWRSLALFEREGDDVPEMHRSDARYRFGGNRTPSNGAVDPDYALWVYTALPTG